MTTWNVTADDRDERGNIMIEAERRAAERNPAPVAPALAEGAEEEAPPPSPPRPVRAISPSARLRGRDGDAIPASPPRPAAVAGALAGLFLVGVLIALISRAPVAPLAQSTGQPTLAPTAAPAPSPSALPDRPGGSLMQAVVAYAAPDGAVLGSIEPGRGFVPVGRYGGGWVQLDVQGSGRVWVRRGEAPLDAMDMDVLATLPDLAPPPTATPAPAQQAPVAPIAQPRQPAVCDAASAPYRVERQVLNDRNIPIGEFEVWSCVSQADVEQQAAATEAELRAAYGATTEAKTAEAAR